jgi:hypothetical protein
MAWIEVHQSLLTHRKTFALAEQLELPEVYAAAHMVAFWLWSLDNAPEGELKISAKLIAKAAQYPGPAEEFVEAMVSAGWLDPHGNDRYTIHNWHDYAGRLIEQREANAARQRAFRERRKGPNHAQESDVTEQNTQVSAPVTSRNGYVTVTSQLRNGATVPNPTQPNSTGQESTSRKESLQQISAADAATEDELWFDGDGNQLTEPPVSVAPVKQANGKTESPPEKEQRYSTDFEAFWLAYPRPVVRDRGSKSDAYAVWKRMKASERRLATSAALKYRQSETAKREGGKFIPHEATWLRGKRWEVVQEASELPNEADTPPSWASWEKDAAGDWIPLRGDNNGKLPYGAEDHAEVTRLHRQRWEQESKRQKAARTPGSNGLHASDTLTHGGARA